MQKLEMYEHHAPGLLFTVCGLDGCGKTTIIQMLANYFEAQELPIFLTKQPTPAVRKSEIFRNYMDEPDHSGYEYRSLSLLAASDRVQHSNQVILPHLEAEEIVISDRYFYSCLANLRARGYEEDQWIYEIARSIPQPDLAVFLDVDVPTAVRRVRARPEERDCYIDLPLQYRLRENYRQIARLNRAVELSSSREPQNTFQRLLPKVSDVIRQKAALVRK